MEVDCPNVTGVLFHVSLCLRMTHCLPLSGASARHCPLLVLAAGFFGL
jgi:hypothetical protein